MNFFQAMALICAAVLLAQLVWELRSRLIKPDIGGAKTTITVIIDSQGSPAELERSVKGLLRLISSNTMSPGTRIIIQNTGGCAEIEKMALILERDYEAVSIAERG